MTGRPEPPSRRTGVGQRQGAAGSSAVRGVKSVRAALGMGLTWAATVFVVSVVLWLLAGPDAADVFFPAGFAVFGLVGGVLFSVILRVFDGRRGVLRISLPRASAWGGASGLLLSGLFVSVAAWVGETTPLEHVALLGPVFALCGAVLAAGLLAFVRRGGRRGIVRSRAEVAGLVSREGRQ